MTKKISKKLEKELTIQISNGCNQIVNMGKFFEATKLDIERFTSTLKTLIQTEEISKRNCAFMNCNNCPFNLMVESIEATINNSHLEDYRTTMERYNSQ